MATRADHFKWADELVWGVRRDMAGKFDPTNTYQREQAALRLAAAQVHATLATASADTEYRVTQNEIAAARQVEAELGRVARAEAERGALGAPASVVSGYTRNDDCAELDRDTFGDCDGSIGEYSQIGTAFGLPLGGLVKLCRSHADQAARRERIRALPLSEGPDRGQS